MDVLHFLEGAIPDGRGRTLSMIMALDDQAIESTHDFIQWIFPLDEPSRSHPGAPVLDLFEIEEIKSSEIAQENLMQSADWYFGFLHRHDHWMRQYDHNHLRITRVIKSLRLLVSDEVADRYKATLLNHIADRISKISGRSCEYWSVA